MISSLCDFAPNQVANLPFHVHRTQFGELPVYSEFKNKKARVSTLVRRVTGDMEGFETELRTVVGPKPVIKRRVASFEVFGDHKTVLADWLLRCGF